MDDLADQERFVGLQGCFNFRDLGGYRTTDGGRLRWQLLYRSGGLQRLTDPDVAVLRRRQLRTVVDLRSPGEMQRMGSAPSDLGATVVGASMTQALPGAAEAASWSDPEQVAAHYLGMLQAAAPAVTTALEALSQPGALPGVFHCTVGKDRTGVLAAVVLGALGVTDDDIVTDYTLSLQPARAFLAWLRGTQPDALGPVEKLASVITSVEPQAMREFLAGVRRQYESFDGLIDTLGAGSALKRLRDQLVG